MQTPFLQIIIYKKLPKLGKIVHNVIKHHIWYKVHSVAVCAYTLLRRVLIHADCKWPSPTPSTTLPLYEMFVSFKRNCRSGRIFSVTRQCLNRDSVGTELHKGIHIGSGTTLLLWRKGLFGTFGTPPSYLEKNELLLNIHVC